MGVSGNDIAGLWHVRVLRKCSNSNMANHILVAGVVSSLGKQGHVFLTNPQVDQADNLSRSFRFWTSCKYGTHRCFGSSWGLWTKCVGVPGRTNLMVAALP